MICKNTPFEGLKIIETFHLPDRRGQFIKIYSNKFFQESDIDFEIKESYYSISRKCVIRGMHFQLPPEDHIKLVNVQAGAIIDVCVDLRKNSATYKKVFRKKLTAFNNLAIYIPKGFAHGFEVLSNDTIVHYLQSTGYSKERDFGILWNSIDHNWITENPVLSERDKSFMTFEEFIMDKKLNLF